MSRIVKCLDYRTVQLIAYLFVFISNHIRIVLPQSTQGYFYQEYYSMPGCTGNVTFSKGYLSTASYDPNPVCLPISTTQSMSIFCDFIGTKVYSGPSTKSAATVVMYNSANCKGDAVQLAKYPMGTCAPVVSASSDVYFGISLRSLCNRIPSPPIRAGLGAILET
jgi:hypothetical protein